MKQNYPYKLQKTQWVSKCNIFILLTGILLLQANFTFAQWTRKADALRKRAECPSVLYKGKIYVFGGFGEHPSFETASEVYDPTLDKWTLLATFPTGKKVSHQGVALVDDKIWHIGGRAVNADGPVTSQVIIYDITNNRWMDGPQLRDPATGNALPIGGGGAALLGRTLHVFGGFAPTICIDQSKYHLTLDVDKWLENPANTKWENKSAPMPIPRNHLNTAVLGGKIYAIGGQFGHDCNGKDQKYTHSYDPISNTWTRLTDLPSERSHSEMSTFPVDGKIFVVGGQGQYGVAQNTVLVLNPGGNSGLGSWTNNTQFQLPNLYYGISGKVIGNKFIISHGALKGVTNERKETYSASITRNTPNTFGFVAKCFSKTVNSNATLVIKNLLFTIEGQKQYSLSSNASWLKVSKNATGLAIQSGVDIEATINTAGLAKGSYSGTITATGTGTGATFTSASFCVNLTVGTSTTGQQVVSFTLINADTDQAIQTLDDGATLNLATLPTKNLNIRANTSPTTVGSVKFVLSGTQSRTFTESGAPYALFGNSGTNYYSWTPGTGSYTLKATPYSASGASGTVGTSLTIDFSVVNSTTTNQQLVSNITSTTGRSYTLGELRVGTTIYTDRTYQATTVPSYLNGAPLIKTANADKGNTSTTMLSFKLSQDATVYVGYDPRTTALPAWLSTWQKLTNEVGINDPGISNLDLYSKTFPAGTVSLGGNLASPAAGALNNYIVIAKARQSLTSSRIGSLNKNLEQATVLRENLGLKLQVYPNPLNAGNKIQVTLEGYASQEAVGITMYDALGKIIQSKILLTDIKGTGSTEISVKRINRGFYIIKAQAASGNKQLKLLIE